MKRTKKGALTLLLALCVTLGLLPALTPAASAAETYGLYVGGVQITSDNLTVNGGSGTAAYDPAKRTLTLNNYSYTGSGTNIDGKSGGIDYRGNGNLEIVLKGSNSIAKSSVSSPGESYGIYFNVDSGTLTISGDGSLDISFEDTSSGISKRNGIFCEPGAFVMESGTVTAAGGYAEESAGIFAQDGITFNGGTFTGIGNPTTEYESRGIYANTSANITINGGTVTAQARNSDTKEAYAFQAKNTIVNGGKVTASASATGDAYAFRSVFGIALTVNGGEVTASASSKIFDGSISIGAGATVEAGTDASGTGATVVTDVANNTSYKYAKITLAPATPSYTVTAADTTTTVGKKYHYGDEFTIAVTVSGADFEGGEFTLTYDKDMFQLTTEAAAPGKNDNDAKNTATGNKFNADSDGKYAFILNNRTNFKDGDAIVTLTFKVTGKTMEEKAFDFAFDTTNSPKICYDTDKDSVAATATKGSVTLEPILYAVTLTPNPSGDFTLTGDNGVANADNANAIDGQAYTVAIDGYDADNYSYAVALKVGGTAVASPPRPDSNGIITLAVNSFGGDIVMTVTRTLANFTVDVVHNYVSGWTLVTVAKTDANNGSPVYNYDGNAMYYVEAYKAYAYLVKKPDSAADALTAEAATAKVSLGTTAAAKIAAGYDVNNTGKVDYSDALLTYRCYLVADKTPDTSMETYLRADVDASKKVDTGDISAIDANRTAQEAPEPT